MKKRITAVLIMMLVLIATVFACVSCSSGIFEKDENRDYHQVIATVNYEGISKDIYKGQVLTYVNAYGATYQQQYGLSAQEVVEYFYNNLTQNALVTLYAKSYIYKAANNISEPARGDGNPAKAKDAYSYVPKGVSLVELNKDPSNFLTLGEYVYAIETSNAEMLSTYETIYEELYNEQVEEEEEEEEEEKTEEEELTPRTVRTYSNSSTSEYNENNVATSIAVVFGPEFKDVKYGDITLDFVKTIAGSKENFIQKLSFNSQVDARIAAETDAKLKSLKKSAKNKFLENIETNYMTIDEFVKIQVDAAILQSYRRNVKDAQLKNNEEINKLYNQTKTSELKTNLDATQYSSALQNNRFTLVNADNRYVGVKSILLQFNDEQKAALEAIKTAYPSSSAYQSQLRNDMALGKDNAIIKAFYAENEGIKVNVSNPLYVADEDKVAQAYTDKDVPFMVILAAMADNMAVVSNEIVEAYKASDEYKELSDAEKENALKIVENNAKVEAFTQWIYLVNDDPGMFSNDSYLITPDGEDTSYVAEFAVLGRKLGEENTLGVYALDGGMVENKNLSYQSSTTFLNIEDTTIQLAILKDQTSTTKDGTEISTDIYTVETAKGNKLSFIINDFGIHIIMVTKQYGCGRYDIGKQVEAIDKDGNVVADPVINADAVAGYVYTTDYINDDGCTINYDYTYTKVAKDAIFDAETKYYKWDVNAFVKAEIASTEELKNGEYYTRAWGLKSVSVDYKTYADTLFDTIVGNISTDQLTKDQIVIFFDEIDDSKENKYIIKNEKTYKKMLKDLGIKEEDEED